MRVLDWYAAPYAAHGDTAGEGAKKVLGRPHLPPLTVLVRETVQNSWDAQREGVQPAFDLSLRHLGKSEQAVVRDCVFGSSPGVGLGLERVLTSERLPVLEISDRRTTGLQGPVRADRQPDSGVRTDYIDLVFNIGAPQDRAQGGGTYGFGKSIAYVVSRVSTVLIATRTADTGEARFIASAIGDHFSHGGRRYTGRHWWGVNMSDYPAPVTGVEALELIDSLGIPSFAESGTTIVVIDPDLGGRSPAQAMDFLVEALLWNVWPKMIRRYPAGPAPMEFTCRLEHGQLSIPDVRTHHKLQHFVRALELVRAGGTTGASTLPHKLVPISIQRPRRRLGTLAMVKHPDSASAPARDPVPDTTQPLGAAPFEGPSHHVALMRQVELVVEYRPCRPLGIGGFGWSGVFKCDAAVDDVFAESEPPAHDYWKPEFVQGRTRQSLVRVGLREIERETRRFAEPVADTGLGSSGPSTAIIADRLWAVVPTISGTGASVPTRLPRSATQRPPRQASVDILGTELEVEDEGQLLMWVEFNVSSSDPKGRIPVIARASVRLESGTETSPPVGAALPRIVGVRRFDTGERVSIDQEGRLALAPGRWRLVVECSEPTAVDVDIRPEA